MVVGSAWERTLTSFPLMWEQPWFPLEEAGPQSRGQKGVDPLLKPGLEMGPGQEGQSDGLS